MANPKDIIGRTKMPLELLPPKFLEAVALVMGVGAKKYGPWNWRSEPINLTVYIGAALRHVEAVNNGEDIDAESGQHHLAHAAACCAIVLDAIANKCLIDDRPGRKDWTTTPCARWT